MTDLPIEEVLPELENGLRAHPGAVLQAPPGAGKTTRVPLALLDEPWLDGGRIIMLEPRRLAARAAARRMSELRGERVGGTVGYRVRMDTQVGPQTRIEVVTEGVLTRMLQDDPALEGIGLVIFDEFHERSLHADLGLALSLQARTLLRPDLRVLVMSATLDAEPVAELLSAPPTETPAPIVTSEGREHPVETRYRGRAVDGWIEPVVANAVRTALEEEDGDILVFLPGAREIKRTEKRLTGEGDLPDGVHVAPLFGNLPREAQDRAIEPSPPGRRKVVLATSIAETSLTIEGIRVVIDSGLMRIPRFSPRTGMSRLETVRATRASADQRRGRAGRLGPGVCYRLWTEHEQRRLVPHRRAEILEADLAPLALELAAWGVHDRDELRWLDPPPSGAFAQARELLAQLGALDADGAITDHGRRMARLGMHPRLAHMALQAQGLELGAIGCELAALLEEVLVERYFGGQMEIESSIAWDGDAGAVRCRQVERLGALVLKDAALPDPDPEAVADALLDGIRDEGLGVLPWSKGVRRLRQRLIFMHRHDAGWPDLSGETLLETLAEWLRPYIYGMKSRDDLQRLDLAGIVRDMLSWEQRKVLDDWAPTHLVVPSGSRIPIDYGDPDAPVLAVRLQEMFGLRQTPRIARGSVPLTLHLLSPAQRPVQVTQDLASFWRDAYFEVRKEMKGRYPKHYWPDDPLEATPTNRVRPGR